MANGSGTKASQTGSDKNKFIIGLKFVSININSIRGKKLELLLLAVEDVLKPPRMGYVILLWHSLSLPYNYFP